MVYAPVGGPRTRKQQQQQQQQQASGTAGTGEAYYLVGPWPQVQVDPDVWGFGPKMGVLDYTVKDATQRLLQCK